MFLIKWKETKQMCLYIFTRFHSFESSSRNKSIENNIQRKLPDENMYYLSTSFACVHHQPTKSIIKNRIVAKQISPLFWSRLSHQPYQPTSPTKTWQCGQNLKVGEFGREGESRQSVELGNPGHLVKSGKMGELGQHRNEGNSKIKEN